MASETLTIDPGATPLELATGADGFYLRDFKSPPPARKTVFATSQDTEGSVLVDSEYDPRTINAIIRATASTDRPTWYAKLDKLQQKIAKINEQGAVLARKLIGASTTGYYDLIGDCEADIPWDAARYGKAMDVDISLNFLAKPFIRGDEVAFIAHSEVTLPVLIFTEVGLKGDVTGLGRFDIRNDSGNDQLVAWWGQQCRYYDSSLTSALFYEAESLTPLDTAATFAIAGSSGGGNNTVRHAAPNTSNWTPILSTDIVGVGKMTHKGTYRVLARVYATFTGAKPTIKFMYGSGDLTRTQTLNTVTMQTTAQHFVHDFGLVRLAGSQWGGVFHGKAGTAGDTISIDCLMFIPVDEGYGFAKSIQPPSDLVGLYANRPPSTSVDDATVGQLAWANPTNVYAEDGAYASCATGGEAVGFPGGVSQSTVIGDGRNVGAVGWSNIGNVVGAWNGDYAQIPWTSSGGWSYGLYPQAFGFNIPSGAVITGIKVSVYEYSQSTEAGQPFVICMTKAGVNAGSYKTDTINTVNAWIQPSYGNKGDLWGTTWTPADINASGFGVNIALAPLGMTPEYWDVGEVKIIVYYTVETHYLKVTGFGFTLPSSTVTGISVSIKGLATGGKLVNQKRVRIVKGGVIQATDYASSTFFSTSNAWYSYGGDNYLWGTTWAYTDINAATFGVAFNCQEIGDLSDGNGGYAGNVFIDAVKITVFYTTSGGFQATADAVAFANGRTLEINDSEVKRQNLGGTFYVPVASYAGTYLRVPPSRQEARALRVIAKMSRSSDPPTVSDSSIDDLTGQLFYTPRYLMHPDS